MAATVVDEHALRDLQRELQRKIDKARPVFEQHEAGELKVLSPEQQRLVDAYPGYVADLAEVKAGRMPAPRAKPQGQQQHKAAKSKAPQDEVERLLASVSLEGTAAAAADGDDGEPDAADPSAAGKTGKQLKREKAAARKAAAKSGGKKNRAKSEASVDSSGHAEAKLSEHERVLLAIAKAHGKTQKALVDAQLASKVDRSRLLELEREYDGVCQLRRDILSGKIAKPSKLQTSKVQLAEALKKDVEAEQAALRSTMERHRILLMAEVEELAERTGHARREDDEDEDEDDEAAEEVADDAAQDAEAAAPAAAETADEAAAAEATEAAAEEPAACLKPDTPRNAPDPETPVARSPAAEPVAAPAEEQAAVEAEEEEAPREPTPQPAKAPSEPQDDAVAENDDATAADEPAAEQAAKEEEEPAAPAEPERAPTPPPPKPIDWDEVVITKNRRTLAPPNKRGASPADAGARSGSPGRSPTGAAPAAASAAGPAAAERPTSLPTIMFTEAHAKAAAPSPSKKGADKKGGAPKQQPAAKSVGGASSFRQTAAARLTRELQECQQAPLPNVACTTVEDSVFRWAVNVAVADGPLAGLIVPLELHFSDFYPQEPPLVKSLVDIPHPAIVPSQAARNTLCMEHTAVVNPRDVSATRGWSPAYGAFSVLSQLQGFFAKENFAKLEKGLGAKVFAARVRNARIAIGNCANAAVGHTPAVPVPAVPMLNGPMRHTPEAVLLKDGAIRCRAAGEGNVWRHSYGTSGTHAFRLTLRGAKGGALVGVTTDGDREDQSQLGKLPGTWALDTVTGSLWAEGTETPVAEETRATLFPLPRGATVDVTVEPAVGRIVFSVHGGVVTHEVASAGSTGPFAPAYCLLSAQAAAELAFFVGGCAIPEPSSAVQPSDADAAATAGPDAAASAAGATAGTNGKDGSDTDGSPPSASPTTVQPSLAPGARVLPRCAITLKAPADGALVCLGLEVSKRHRTHLPAELRSTATYVAQEAFAKISGQRAPNGYRFDFALPLLLDPAHSQRALPALKRTITAMCRNPLASTLYDPPFRPQLACAVFAELLRGVIRDVLHAKAPDYGEAFVLYTRLVHGFAALAAESPAIVKEAQATVTMGEVSATVVFAASTVVVESPWPDVVKRALRAEFAGREPESDADGFALLKRALPKLLVGAAMARGVRFASLGRAVEVLAANGGAPPDEIAAEVLGALAGRSAVTSWDAMCDYFGVSTTAAEVGAL